MVVHDSSSDPGDDTLPQTTIHVRRAFHGDTASLNWIVARLTPLLIVQAEYRLGSALRREIEPTELVNEAWIAVLPKLAELGERDGRVTPVLLKYLSTTMTYCVNRLLRQRSTGPRIEPGDVAMGQLPASTSGVITRAARREVRDVVRERLDDLDPPDREVIVLRGIEQHPSKTVARMLEISSTAVDQRYSRALKRLRGDLQDSVFAELDDR